MAEQRLRGGARYDVGLRSGREPRYRLTGWRRWGASAFAGVVLLLAFIVPLGQLLAWVWQVAYPDLDERYVRFFLNTLMLGAAAAAVTTFFALLLAYTYRLKPDRFTRAAVRFATLGYALPGSVLAVGIMLSFVWIDNTLVPGAQRLLGFDPAPLLTGTLVALILAYGVRFMAVAHGPDRQHLRTHQAELVAGGALARRQQLGNPLARVDPDAAHRIAERGPAGVRRGNEGDAGDAAAAAVRLGYARHAHFRDDLGRRVGARGAAGGDPGARRPDSGGAARAPGLATALNSARHNRIFRRLLAAWRAEMRAL